MNTWLPLCIARYYLNLLPCILQVNKYHSVLHLVLPGIPQQADLPEEAPNTSKSPAASASVVAAGVFYYVQFTYRSVYIVM